MFDNSFHINLKAWMDNTFFSRYFATLFENIALVDQSQIIRTANLIKSVSRKGNKTVLIGNGGSAAMASHVAIDLTKAAGIRAINFNEADLLTCFANDYGYENVFESALKFYADKGDALIAISSSGMSKNILNAVNYANKNGLYVITFSGFNSKNSLKNLGKINFFVESKSYNVVEMTHHIWLVSIVDYLADNCDFEN